MLHKSERNCKGEPEIDKKISIKITLFVLFSSKKERTVMDELNNHFFMIKYKYLQKFRTLNLFSDVYVSRAQCNTGYS